MSYITRSFSLEPETIEKLDRIARETFRTKSGVIDLLVSKEYERLYGREAAAEPKEMPVQEGGD